MGHSLTTAPLQAMIGRRRIRRIEQLGQEVERLEARVDRLEGMLSAAAVILGRSDVGIGEARPLPHSTRIEVGG